MVALDLSAQTRAEIDQKAVEDYAELLKAGQALDPGLAFKDGTLILACGYHRRLAYKQAGHDQMPLKVREGGLLDASRAGIEDNRKHRGVRLTRADQRRALEMVLTADPSLSDRMVAELVGGTHPLVADVRRSLEAGVEIHHPESRMGRDGHSYSEPSIAEASSSEDDVCRHNRRQDRQDRRRPLAGVSSRAVSCGVEDHGEVTHV
jgi:ParB-like chromosome segregation protein Spo0J